jgi:hypothetical protein
MRLDPDDRFVAEGVVRRWIARTAKAVVRVASSAPSRTDPSARCTPLGKKPTDGHVGAGKVIAAVC